MNLAQFSAALSKMDPKTAFATYDSMLNDNDPKLGADKTNLAVDQSDLGDDSSDTLLSVDIDGDDGSIVIDINPKPKASATTSLFAGHFENLAEKIGDAECNRISEELLEGIEADDSSRSDWLSSYSDGLSLLGLSLAKGSKVGAPVEGQSTVQHPVLLEAVIRYSSNALGEMLPSSGPVKVANFGEDTENTSNLARMLEKDFNYYLMNTASEFRPDTDQMLFKQGFCGLGIKKIYNCPRRRRPVSESVDPVDLIVSNTATDLENAARVTHRIHMRPSIMRRMQLLGVYREVDLQEPIPEPNAVDDKRAAIVGVEAKPVRPEDADHEIYECYCELDLKGYEHKKKGKPTGLQLPYRVTIERTSRVILDIRRNWNEGDTEYKAKKFFVLFPFINAFGIYGIGLLHMLGNSTRALTAAWRVLLDLGMFQSFPGFIYAKQLGRQQHNEFRIPPGGGLGIETGGAPLKDVISQMPYKEPSQAMMALVENIAQAAQRLGFSAEAKIGEGQTDAPVGTTIALIEQATKVEGAVHKRSHQAQAEEFQLLKERFKEDPEAFWRFNKRPSTDWKRKQFVDALNNSELVPVSDPNTPSRLHRIMKASALMELAKANPDILSVKVALQRALDMMDVGDQDALFLPPQAPNAPQASPDKMADIAIKQEANQLKSLEIQEKAQNNQAELHSKNNIALLNLAREAAIHPESAGASMAVVKDPSIAALAP